MQPLGVVCMYVCVCVCVAMLKPTLVPTASYQQVQYPQGIKTGYTTFRHIHDRDKRPRDQKRYHNQWEVSCQHNIMSILSVLLIIIMFQDVQ